MKPKRQVAAPLLFASRPLAVLDYFRSPYDVEREPGPIGRLEGGAGPSLHWAAAGDLLPAKRYALGELRLFARILPDAAAKRALARVGGRWRPRLAVRDATGSITSHVLESESGDVFLPFDPDEAMRNLWSERYVTLERGATRVALAAAVRRSYYRLRPLIPRRMQILLRRRFSGTRATDQFPRWPAETSLHDLHQLLLGFCARVAGEPLPTIAPWPRGTSWALVLTHDVETEAGVRQIDLLRDSEIDFGYRSSWNFVPLRYETPPELRIDLEAGGNEIGVHGLLHDGRDLGTRRTFRRRLPEIKRHAEEWGAVGFRSPATQRNWDWMAELPFEYDTSYPDTDPYEPQPGGCCSWLPIENGPLVELPITLPQDHTLFEILGHDDESAWNEKALFLRERGGLALMITHPDYAVDGPLVEAYRRFLEGFADDELAWKALPREVAAWWRRRGASSIEHDGGGWQVIGPAAPDAQIRLYSER